MSEFGSQCFKNWKLSGFEYMYSILSASGAVLRIMEAKRSSPSSGRIANSRSTACFRLSLLAKKVLSRATLIRPSTRSVSNCLWSAESSHLCFRALPEPWVHGGKAHIHGGTNEMCFAGGLLKYK